MPTSLAAVPEVPRPNTDEAVSGPARSVAAAVTGVQGLTLAVLGVVTAVLAGDGEADDPGSAWLGAGLWMLAAAGLLVAAWALLRGRHWARSPSLVWQLLMLPVGWSLLDTQSVVGLLVLVSAVAALVSLLALERDAHD